MDIKDMITKSDLGEPYNMLIDFKLDDIFKIEKALQGRQISFSKDIDLKNELSELINLMGIEKVKKLVDIFYRETIYFPKIKETCKDKIRKLIISDFNGHNYTELSRKYGYTERRIRDIVKSKYTNNENISNQLNIFDYFLNKKN